MRNDSGDDLSYSRINFRFLDSSGSELGTEWAYLHGGTNARILSNSAYETVLLPGVTGFFKVWTTIPAASMASYTAAPAGEALPFAKPEATLGRVDRRPEQWSPLVHMPRPPSLAGQRVSGHVVNDDPWGPFCPCGHPQVLAYSVHVSVAAYQDGVITDVQSVQVTGPRPAGTQCDGQPTTGMSLHEGASFTIDLARPANRIANQSVEWEEMDLSGWLFIFSELEAHGSLTVTRQCGWTAASTVPWISVVEGSSSNQTTGRLTLSVDRNASSTSRIGGVNVAGRIVQVRQGGGCPSSISPAAVFLGSGSVTRTAVPVNVSSACAVGASSDSSWLQVFHIGFDDTVRLSAEPNTTGTTRSAVVRLGGLSLPVHQSAGGRNTDFDSDGRLDLLWHHGGDGRVSAWRMHGTQMIDGTLLMPGQMSDMNWTPVGVGDLDSDATTDVVWQNDADGRLELWRMNGTVRREATPISPDRVLDTNWKIRALSDFNRDGHLDFIWQHESTGDVAVWFMRSGTSQCCSLPDTPPTQVSGEALGPGPVTDLDWKIVGSGDFNRDAWPDLVWQHQGDGRIAVWLMRGTTLVAGDLLSPGQISDLDWKIRGVGDVNGDDMADLIWQHRGTGDVSVWLMNGTTMMAGVPVGRVADSDWTIVGPK